MSVYGRRSSKSIAEVATYRPLVNCGMEELAARQRTIKPSSGVQFVRTSNRIEKDAARQMILDLFHPSRWRAQLSILTMPCVDWRFERLLLAAREPGWMQARSPQRTRFTSVESDRSIYFAAVTQMPGVETPNRLIKPVRKWQDRPTFFELGVKTRYAAFFFADVDDLMRDTHWDDGWDAAWLDYTGPLTVARLQLIKQFFQTYVRDTLIVTALKARWRDDTSQAIAKAGDHSLWLRQHLPGEILHDIEYFDTVPMAQFAVRHPIDLGQATIDAHDAYAEIAAGHAPGDAQVDDAGGPSSETRGQTICDAHREAAASAAGQLTLDAQEKNAGGILSKTRGHRTLDAHNIGAASAAAGQCSPDVQNFGAYSGGTLSTTRGQGRVDAHVRHAASAAGHSSIDAHIPDAGGTLSEPTKEETVTWENQCARGVKRKRPRQRKPQRHSVSGSRSKRKKRSPPAKRLHLRLRKKLPRRSVPKKPGKSAPARGRNDNSNKVSAIVLLMPKNAMPRRRRRPAHA
jgi:hypothetical protein